MSGRAKQKPPRNAKRIPPYGDDAAWRRLGIDKGAALAAVDDWLWHGNGFSFWTVGDTPLYLSQDGRTAYGQKFLYRLDHRDTIPSWDYTTTADDSDLITKTYALAIVRPLGDYAPALAERLGLPA